MFIGLFSHDAASQMNRDSLFSEGICDKDGFCIPQLPNLGRSKGVELYYDAALNYPIETTIGDSTYSDTVQKNRALGISVRFPLVLKPNFKLVMGLKYLGEEFEFSDDQVLSNNFYKAINEKSLRSFGTTFYFTRPFKGNSYLAGRSSFRLSGDFTRNQWQDYFRVSATMIYGKRAHHNVVWGAGVSYSYAFGRQLIIPVFAYSHKFNDKWSLTALLPVKLAARYEVNDKNIFKFETQLDGEKYNISIDALSQDNLFLERSDWLTMLIYEREIYDFLWLGVKVGNRYNISFDLSERNTFINRVEPEIVNKLANTLIMQGSIFLVPPKKWSDKSSDQNHSSKNQL